MPAGSATKNLRQANEQVVFCADSTDSQAKSKNIRVRWREFCDAEAAQANKIYSWSEYNVDCV